MLECMADCEAQTCCGQSQSNGSSDYLRTRVPSSLDTAQRIEVLEEKN